MKQFLRFFLLLLSFEVHAQAPTEEWNDEYYPNSGFANNQQFVRGYSGSGSVFVIGSAFAPSASRARVNVLNYKNAKNSRQIADVYACQGGSNDCQVMPYGVGQSLRDGGLVVLSPKIARYDSEMNGRVLSEDKGLAADVLKDGSLVVILEDGKTIVRYGATGELNRFNIASNDYRGISFTNDNDGGMIITSSNGTQKYTATGSPIGPLNAGIKAHRIQQLNGGDFMYWGDYSITRISNDLSSEKWRYFKGVAVKMDFKTIEVDSDGSCFFVRSNETVKLRGSDGEETFRKEGAEGGFRWSNGDVCIWKKEGDQSRFTKYSTDGAFQWNSQNYGGIVSGHPASDGGFFIVQYNPGQINLPGYIRKMTTAPPAPTCNGTVSIAGNQDQSFCEGSSLTLTANSANTTGTVTLQWKKNGSNIGDGKNTLTVNESGTYTVTMTYGSNCTATGNNIIVTRNPRPTANAGPSVTLKQGEFHTISGQPSTQSYLWTTNPIVGGHNSTSANPTFGPFDQNTMITLVVTVNGCASQPSTAQITVQRCNLSVNISGTTEFCAGTSTTLTANANGTYQWKKDGTNVGDGKNTLTATESGSYTVEVTDGGCKATAQAVTLTKSDPKVSIKADRTAYCAGGSVTLMGEPSGGIGAYNFAWKKDGTATGSNSNTLSGAKAGIYTVEATDQKGCKSPVAEQKITENPKPTANAGGTATKRPNETHTISGTTASGGSGSGFSWQWSTNPGDVPGNGATTEKPTFGPFRQNTTITLVVRDGNGCESQPSTALITFQACNLTVKAEASKKEFCINQTSTLTATASGGKVTYQWKKGGDIVGNASTYTASEGGSYTVTVTDTDGNDCQHTSEVVVLTKSDPKVSLKTDNDKDEYCEGGSVTLTANPSGGIGNYTYAWTKNNDSFGGNAQTQSGVKAGTYKVTVTDAPGCTASDERRITENLKPTANAGGPVTRYASDKYTVPGTTATGGTAPYQYSWTTNPGVQGNNSAASNPTFGPFTQSTELTLKVSDAKGCEATSKATVTYSACPLNVTVSPGNTDFCAGGTVPTLTVNVSGQAGTLKYEWKKDGTKVGEAATLTAGESGKYTVTVTDDRCSAPSGEVTIRKSDPKVSVSAEKSEFCAGGTTTLSASASGGLGTYSYQWKKAGINTGGNSDKLTGATGGTYTVEVTDNTGCKVTSAPQSLTEHPKPTVTISGGAAFCEGLSLVLTATMSGGTGPYTHQWNDGPTSVGVSPSTLQVTKPGEYRIMVTDTKGCQILETQKVDMNALPAIRIAGSDQREICVTQGDGKVVLGGDGVLVSQTLAGTVATRQWLHDDQPLAGATGETMVYNKQGKYTLRVTTAGCPTAVTSSPVQVTQRVSSIEAKILPPVPPNLTPGSSIPVNLTAAPGAGYVYQWQHAPNTGQIQNLPGAVGQSYGADEPGTYYVTVAKDGCMIRSVGTVVSFLTGTLEETSFDIQMYPNPGAERLRVKVTTEQPETLGVRLLSPGGQEVGQWQQSQRATSHQLELDLREIPDGLYFLHLQAGSQRHTRKLVRIR